MGGLRERLDEAMKKQAKVAKEDAAMGDDELAGADGGDVHGLTSSGMSASSDSKRLAIVRTPSKEQYIFKTSIQTVKSEARKEDANDGGMDEGAMDTEEDREFKSTLLRKKLIKEYATKEQKLTEIRNKIETLRENRIVEAVSAAEIKRRVAEHFGKMRKKESAPAVEREKYRQQELALTHDYCLDIE